MKTLALLFALLAPVMLHAAEARPPRLPAGAQFVADFGLRHRRTRAPEAGRCIFQQRPAAAAADVDSRRRVLRRRQSRDRADLGRTDGSRFCSRHHQLSPERRCEMARANHGLQGRCTICAPVRRTTPRPAHGVGRFGRRASAALVGASGGEEVRRRRAHSTGPRALRE